MPAPKGNQFWKARSSHGRNPIFADSEKLWDCCQEYFEWCEDNPLLEEKIFHNQGEVTRATIAKMRAMTISGLCIFLGICETTWSTYRDNKDFLVVITRAERVIYAQKFSGAAADLLNANIIARDLGLRDKLSSELTGPNGGPLQLADVSFTFNPVDEND